jgi:hypothetical protein
MRKWSRFSAIFLGILAFMLIAGLTVERMFFSSIVIESGGTFGFEIGQTREEAYETAEKLIAQGRAAEIHTWPAGEFHRPFRHDEDPVTDDSPAWSIIVDPEWWNNSVTLAFTDGRVVSIRRNRVLTELP